MSDIINRFMKLRERLNKIEGVEKKLEEINKYYDEIDLTKRKEKMADFVKGVAESLEIDKTDSNAVNEFFAFFCIYLIESLQIFAKDEEINLLLVHTCDRLFNHYNKEMLDFLDGTVEVESILNDLVN